METLLFPQNILKVMISKHLSKNKFKTISNKNLNSQKFINFIYYDWTTSKNIKSTLYKINSDYNSALKLTGQILLIKVNASLVKK